MKKVLSFVLVLTLVLGSFSVAFAAAPADVQGTDWENAVVALTDLGVVNGYTDGTYKPENAVNRAEAAKLIISALGLSEYAEGITSTSFTDLAGFGWAVGYIGYAESLGILKGVGNNMYNPAGQVTYEQVCTMIVRAIGWNDENLVGTWPANYVVKAKSLGILDDIAQAGSAPANRGDVAIMIYNAIDEDFVSFDKDGSPYWTVGDNMLSRLVAKSGLVEGVVLTDMESYAKGVNLMNQYGAYVDVFTSDNKITGIKSTNSVFLTGKFTTGAAVKDTKFVTDDVTYDVQFKSEIVTLTNGLYAATTAAIAAVADVPSGEKTIAVDLSGKTIKDVYSIATWDPTGTVQWDDSLANALKKNNKLDKKEFKMTDGKEIDTTQFTLLGVDSLDKIAEDAIVTYYVNDKITKVEVSTATVEGKVTKINKDLDAVTINGTTYDLGDDLDLTFPADWVGSEGTYYLNYAGEIVLFDGTEECADYALVTVNAKAYDTTGFNPTSKYAIEMMTADGKVKEYQIDSDLSAIVTGGALVKGNIIAYSLDEDGVIDAIEEEAADTNVTATAADKRVYTAKGYLCGTKVADNVVVFKGTNDDTWGISTVADLGVNDEVANTTYVIKDDKIVAIYTNNNTAKGTYGLVTGYSTVKNDNNKNVYEIEMLLDGAVVAKKSTRDFYVAGVTTNLDKGAYQLVIVTTSGVEVADIDVVGATTFTTVTGIGNGSIKTDAAFEEVSDKVVVYQLTFKNDGDLDVAVVSDFASISKYDYVALYELDDDEDGYDIIVFVEQDDYDNAVNLGYSL